MPHRTSAGGTYRIDRVFRGVGRIAVASGATTKGEFKKRNDLLSRLFDRGRLDLLRAIQARTYSLTEVYVADCENRLGALTGDRKILARPLWVTVETWLDYTVWETDGAKKRAAPTATHRRYGVSFKALKARAGLPESATIEHLGAVDWYALKAAWPKSDGDWAHLRAAVSRFLSDQLAGRSTLVVHRKPLHRGLHHPLRLKVMDDFPTAKAAERIPDITPELFWQIVNQTPEFVRAAYVVMATLGLRVGEYLRLSDTDLLPHTKQVRIPGTKTAGSASTLVVDERLWPWIAAGVPSPLKYGWLRKYWVRAREAVGAGDVRLHDLRHCPAQWLTDAGRSEASVQSFMRHATPAMTRRYAMQRDRGDNARVLADVLLPTGTE